MIIIHTAAIYKIYGVSLHFPFLTKSDGKSAKQLSNKVLTNTIAAAYYTIT